MRYVRLILSLISVCAPFVGELHAATPTNCTIAYEKLAAASVIDENAKKLMDGQLTITDLKSGEKLVVFGKLRSRTDNGPQVLQPTTIAELKIFTKNASGKLNELGRVKVNYKRQTKELFIANVFVEPAFQQQGLSTLALAEVMKQFPEAKTVTGKLVGDNAKEFILGTKSGTASSREEAIINGFKNTPFYKALSMHGFSEVDPHASRYDPFAPGIDQIYIQLRRPANP